MVALESYVLEMIGNKSSSYSEILYFRCSPLEVIHIESLSELVQRQRSVVGLCVIIQCEITRLRDAILKFVLSLIFYSTAGAGVSRAWMIYRAAWAAASVDDMHGIGNLRQKN